MAARKVLVIDAPIFVMVDVEADEEDVASEFNSGFQSAIEPFESFGPGNPDILDAAVREIRVATPEEIEAVGIELEGEEQE